LVINTTYYAGFDLGESLGALHLHLKTKIESLFPFLLTKIRKLIDKQFM